MIMNFILLVTVDYKQCAYFLHTHMYKNTYIQLNMREQKS